MKFRRLLPSLALAALLAACGTAEPNLSTGPEWKTYLVFFSFGKSDITPEAEQIIGQAAEDAKKSGSQIVLTGHADSAGSSDYNQRLSEARAVAVRSALVRVGVAESTIQTVGDGESPKRPPIADGIRERRVEIALLRRSGL
jgi:OOP family OmpA-OmpF porin